MRVKARVALPTTWVDALPESLKHEFSLEELEQMKKQVLRCDLSCRVSDGPTRLCLRMQFADFDTSGDGSIAASELVVLMRSMGIDASIDEVRCSPRRH